jgi:hypothetical protein
MLIFNFLDIYYLIYVNYSFITLYFSALSMCIKFIVVISGCSAQYNYLFSSNNCKLMFITLSIWLIVPNFNPIQINDHHYRSITLVGVQDFHRFGPIKIDIIMLFR